MARLVKKSADFRESLPAMSLRRVPPLIIGDESGWRAMGTGIVLACGNRVVEVNSVDAPKHLVCRCRSRTAPRS